MIKKMVQHGNSSALIIDKPIMELLKIDNETPLEIVTDGRNLIISPVSDLKKMKRLENALTKINLKHGKTLKRLSE